MNFDRSFILPPGTQNNDFIDDDVRIEIKKFLSKNGVDVSGLRDSQLLSKVEEIDK